MNATLRTQVQVAPIAMVVMALGITNWVLAPARALHWGIVIGTMIAIWLVVTLLGRMAEIREDESERSLLATSAMSAGILFAATLAIALYRNLGHAPGAVGSALQERGGGVLIGLLLAAMGNMVPKIIKPLAARRCSHVASQSMRRFTGWAFALAGVGYTLAWLLLPTSLAEKVSTGLCAAAVVLVATRLIRSFTSKHSPAM